MKSAMLGILFLLPVLALLLAVPVLIGVYVYRDASRRGMNAALWTLASAVVPMFAGFILYLLIRGGHPDLRCPRCGSFVGEAYTVCPSCGARLKCVCPACGGGLGGLPLLRCGAACGAAGGNAAGAAPGQGAVENPGGGGGRPRAAGGGRRADVFPVRPRRGRGLQHDVHDHTGV